MIKFTSMIKTKSSKSKYALLAVVFVSLFLIAVPVEAKAAGDLIDWIASALGISDIAAKAIGWVVYVVNYIIGTIAGVFFSIGAWLLEWLLDANSKVLFSPVVALGWGVVRDVANLAFVLIIVIIAFATILRFESYGMKQTLWKLIVAAVLVNFSLVIAGVFVDFAAVLSEYFQKETNLGVGKTAEVFARAFQVNKLLGVGQVGADQWKYYWDYDAKDEPSVEVTKDVKCDPSKISGNTGQIVCTYIPNRSTTTVRAQKVYGKSESAFKGAEGPTLTEAMMIAIASVFFNVVFTAVALFTVLAIAFMLLVRYVALGILLIVMPFAWAAWVLPSTSNLWSKWWDSFLRWTMFLPVMLFFFWLAFTALDKLGQTGFGLLGGGPSDTQAAQAINKALAQSSPTEIIGQMVMIIGLLLGGLFAAQQFSITGSKTFMGWAGGMGKWAGGRARRAGLWGAHKIGGPKPTKEGEKSRTERLSGAGRDWRRGTQWLAAPIRGAGHVLNRFGAAYEKGVAGVPEELKGWSAERKNIEARRSSGPRRAAILANLAKSGDIDLGIHKGLIDAAHPENLERLENAFKKFGLNEKDLTRALGVDAKTLRTIGADPTNAEAAGGAFEKLYRNWKPEDFAKTDFSSYFKADAAAELQNLRAAMTYGIAAAQPGAAYKIYPNMKAGEVETMNLVFKNQVATIRDPDKRARAEVTEEKAFAKRFGGETTPPTTATETS